MSDDLIYTSAGKLLEGYAQKKISPVEVIHSVLTRVEEKNSEINAFNLVDSQTALESAQESEARWFKGNPNGLLDGVPVSIKDLILTRGWPTLKGSLTTKTKGPWNEDAPCVARLREHGAVLFGKTTTPEFGWKGITDSSLTGITRNPWNLEKTPGGSSGGASAALAAGMGPLAIGSDGGGSIRIPASFTGVFGIKANYGRVPTYPESAMRNLSHIGPMSLTVADAALLLTVISEPDHRDWTALPYTKENFTTGLDDGIVGLKMAYSRDLGYAEVDTEVLSVVDTAVSNFKKMGASIEETDPGFSNPSDAFRIHWWVGAAGALGNLPESEKQQLEREFRDIVEKGLQISISEYTAAMAFRTQLCIEMREFHRKFDILLTPSIAVPPFDVGLLRPPTWADDGTYWSNWTPFTFPFNMTQQPACSVPCGFTKSGLPVGLQIVANNFREDLVFRAAREFEKGHPQNKIPPGF